MKRTTFLTAATIAAAVFFQCGPRIVDISQRGGSGTETVGISGSAVDMSGIPIAGASVKLRRSDFLDTAGLPRHDKGVFLAETVTDTGGKFHFGSIDTGAYFIEINDGNHHGALVRCVVDAMDSVLTLPKAQLRPTGSIFGKIPPAPQTDSMKFSIFIYGLAGHAQTTARGGGFTLTDIPSGAYTLKIIPHLPIYSPKDMPITVADGRLDTLGTVNMTQSNIAIFPTDSSTLRAILDSNRWFSVPVSNVAEIDAKWPKRVTKLSIGFWRFGELTFGNLTPLIGKLSELRSIDIEGESLSQLPEEIGNCKKLHELTLSANQIETLPSTIGDIDSLEQLSVQCNRLENLPREISRLRYLEVLDVGSNSLSSIPRDIALCQSMKALIANHNFIADITDFAVVISGMTDLPYIDLSNNLLKDLPQIITSTQARKPFININGNKLCDDSLSKDISSWLNMYSYSKDWQASQICH